MIPCNIEGLTKFLKSQNLEPTFQKETGQVYVIFKLNTLDFPLFFRIYEGDEMLQILIFFPLQVKQERFAPVARMLHFINKEIDVPGFGMDEAVGLVFHRIMIPVFDKQIDTHLLTTYLQAVPKICSQFFPTISGTAQSDMKFEEIIKKSLAKGR